MRQNATQYAKTHSKLFDKLFDKYKQSKPYMINKNLTIDKSSKTGTYIEKYIQSKLNPNAKVKFQLQPGLVDLRNIQIPILPGRLEFNKIVYSSRLMGEVDILQINGNDISIIDIKCVNSNCDKYCFIQQCIYSYLYYKVYDIIPQNQIYYVYAQKTWQWQLDKDDMEYLQEIIDQ